jgi:hypothetical protein
MSLRGYTKNQLCHNLVELLDIKLAAAQSAFNEPWVPDEDDDGSYTYADRQMDLLQRIEYLNERRDDLMQQWNE